MRRDEEVAEPEIPIGRFSRLPIRRFGTPGAFLAVNPDDERAGATVVLLPGGEIPEGAREGDELSVFLYLDSENRPIATLRAPHLELGEVGFLEVTSVTAYGAFVDWGMPKELLVPLAEQTAPMKRGERYAVGVVVDRTGRLGATMRVSEMLRERGKFVTGEWVEGVAWRNDPKLGLFVIVERRYVGLVPRREPHSLGRGQTAQFRVAIVHGDGKIELSLRARAHEAQADDAKKILDVLTALAKKGKRVGDKSDPEELRELFGLSKKAFKRGVGKLLKDGAVTVDRDGFVRVGGGSASGAERAPTRTPRAEGGRPGARRGRR